MRFTLVFSAVALASLTSCSDPIPQTPDGAFYLALVSPGGQCMINGHTAQVGGIDAANRNTVVTDGTSAVDGGPVTHVTCSVTGTTTFNVHGKIDDIDNSGNSLEMIIGGIAAGATEANPAKGSAVFTAPWTAGNGYSGPCNFWFSPMTKEAVDVTGGVGRAWVSFSCAALSSGMSTCPLKTGFAIFENCLTQ